MVKKDTWVLIHRVILKPEERAPQTPDDTKHAPLEMWIKGRLLRDAEIGGRALVTTRTGRTEEGTLLEANPAYRHGFGDFVPELQGISEQVRRIVFEGETG
ncbi:MAG: 2-amino-4-ketopentanoate thiolase [Spirochaetaceae bacterium]|jgi:hypothetical protein|nr:2-amino-4-ketopentanoate thiolase [Spirochaetaceae bacterium]